MTQSYVSVKYLAPTLSPVQHFPPHRLLKWEDVLHCPHSFTGLPTPGTNQMEAKFQALIEQCDFQLPCLRRGLASLHLLFASIQVKDGLLVPKGELMISFGLEEIIST